MRRAMIDSATIFCALACIAMTSVAWSDETCGLKNVVYDGIFFDGFQGAQDNGLGPALGSVTVPTFGVTPSIAIAYPSGGASFSVGQTSVSGTYTGPAVTGVSVAGIPALVSGGNFIVPVVSLSAGSNTLTAKVTTLDGLTSTAQVTVTYSASTPDITLTPDKFGGPAPFSVGYVLSIPLSITEQSFSFDFGDGSPAYTGSPDNIPRHVYATAGMYTATGTVIDTLSHSHQVSVRIGVNTVAEVRTQLCSVYAYLRGRLVANDSVGALLAFSAFGQDRYHDFLTSGATNLPSVGANLGTLAGGTIAPTFAELVAVIDQGGTIQGSSIQFTIGSDGVWRIESL